jgi:DNA-binding MarR family transcriptional regulator
MKKSELNTEFGTPKQSPGFLLWQISNKWQSEQRKALMAFDLTHVQFVLLASLVWAGNTESFTQKQLAQHAKTDVMMTSQVVRALERKGLITRTTGATDGRSFTLAVTKDGVGLVNKAVVAVESVDKRFFSVLNSSLPTFTAMMQLLAS